MAAVLKKRALAEFQRQETAGSSTTDVGPPPGPKALKMTTKRFLSSVAVTAQDRLSLSTKLAIGVRKPAELLRSCGTKASSGDVVRAMIVVEEELESVQPAEAPGLLDMLMVAIEAQSDSLVKVAIFALLPRLCLSDRCAGFAPIVCEKIVEVLKSNSSEKIQARALLNLRLICEDPRSSLARTARRSFFSLAKEIASRGKHLVKCECLELLSILSVEDGERGSLKIALDHIMDQDPRVRIAAYKAFLKLRDRKAVLHPTMYDVLKTGLTDNYEGVREMALQAVVALGRDFPDFPVLLQNSNSETNRLSDEVFGQVCSAMSDLSLKVRTLSAGLLGTIDKVSQVFVDQTLDKNLMSNMRKKRSAHERNREYVAGGGRPSGRHWGAEDTPREFVDGQAVRLVDLGACGAFVHGLEDQCMAVRANSIESIASLATRSCASFARAAIDFLVDMFNDEIEDVRLKAVHSITRIGNLVVIREDQLDTILSALEDFSLDIREALHEMLSQCRLSSKTCLKMCVEALLDNLVRYPQDRRSLRRCFKNLGANHANLVNLYLYELLQMHPFLDTPESSLNDNNYVCVLIMIFNAAAECPMIFSMLENNVINHYRFLRGSLPHLIPEVQLELEASLKMLPSRSCLSSRSRADATAASVAFIIQVVSPGGMLERCAGDPKRLETAVRDLRKVEEMDSGPARPLAAFSATYVECCRNLSNACLALSGNGSRFCDSRLLTSQAEAAVKLSRTLAAAFSGFGVEGGVAVRRVRLQAVGLQLVAAWKVASGVDSADRGLQDALLALVHAEFLACLKQLETYCSTNDKPPDDFRAELKQKLALVDQHRADDVAKAFAGILPRHVKPTLDVSADTNVRMARATIYEPSGGAESDKPMRFTATLILGVHLDCEMNDVVDLNCVRIKVKYPDQTFHLIAPRKSDVRADVSSIGSSSTSSSSSSTSSLASSSETRVHRILTTVPISHTAWTEACHVKLSICLDVSKSLEMSKPVLTGKSEHMSPLQAALQRELLRRREAQIVDISDEVLVYVSPKPVRRMLT
ncbi:unnamed protein product [Notodromas monacha]|uniref:Integrator complex subunit 4 n=1 Tax=Notodromas monacha TaxID=399045 RepID=A0A7R9BDI8_9CRUS|nr:unnamed protein product [Notodromas monacha]CAG0912793.1 unnamed protein product [Notodromas monacha]